MATTSKIAQANLIAPKWDIGELVTNRENEIYMVIRTIGSSRFSGVRMNGSIGTGFESLKCVDFSLFVGEIKLTSEPQPVTILVITYLKSINYDDNISNTGNPTSKSYVGCKKR